MCTMPGITNAPVFPDPVLAIPIISLPRNPTGIETDWIGLGISHAFSSIIFWMEGASLSSAQVRAHGGMFEPNSFIWFVLRNELWASTELVGVKS
jgi:hypothetical protein